MNDAPDLNAIAHQLVEALRNDQLDEADAMYTVLRELLPESELMEFRVFLDIQRGRVLDVLRFLNELPEDCHPELKAICLNLIDDPMWHSCATELQDSPDPVVRKAMRQLLGQPVEVA